MRALAATLCLMGAGIHANAQVKNAQQTNAMQSALPVTNRKGSHIAQQIIGSGSRNPYKHNWGFKNQRQYRKLVRQVPQIRRSKKCRIKSR